MIPRPETETIRESLNRSDYIEVTWKISKNIPVKIMGKAC